jgi:hypothetical protein
MLPDMRCSPRLRSNLRLTAIDEKLDACDETRIIRREEQRCAGDLVRLSNPTERQFTDAI